VPGRGGSPGHFLPLALAAPPANSSFFADKRLTPPSPRACPGLRPLVSGKCGYDSENGCVPPQAALNVYASSRGKLPLMKLGAARTPFPSRFAPGCRQSRVAPGASLFTYRPPTQQSAASGGARPPRGRLSPLAAHHLTDDDPPPSLLEICTCLLVLDKKKTSNKAFKNLLKGRTSPIPGRIFHQETSPGIEALYLHRLPWPIACTANSGRGGCMQLAAVAPPRAAFQSEFPRRCKMIDVHRPEHRRGPANCRLPPDITEPPMPSCAYCSISSKLAFCQNRKSPTQNHTSTTRADCSQTPPP